MQRCLIIFKLKYSGKSLKLHPSFLEILTNQRIYVQEQTFCEVFLQVLT